MVVDHQSRLENKEGTQKERNITEEFLDENLMTISERPQFFDMANYESTKSVLEDYTWQQKKQFYKKDNHYSWDEPYLIKTRADILIHKCVIAEDARNIMWHFHS